jgi:hypothetical protein
MTELIAGPTQTFIRQLLAMDDVKEAIVERIGLQELRIRVRATKVREVSETFALHWFEGWSITVEALGYVMLHVQGIHIFA